MVSLRLSVFDIFFSFLVLQLLLGAQYGSNALR
jgi:hypothetical protein